MRIALTGGIAEGKSTILAMIAELGRPVFSADAIAREVFESREVQSGLSLLFGVPAPVSRETVRIRVAQDPEARRALNALTHPKIVAAIDAIPHGFFEIPLLIEGCRQTRFDQVWVASCGPAEQLRRLGERYGNPADAERMLALQLPTRVKVAFADLVIRTNCPIADVRMSVAQALEESAF